MLEPSAPPVPELPAPRAKRFPYEGLPPGIVEPTLWEEVRQAPLPSRSARLEPMSSVVPRVLLVAGALAGTAVAALVWLPRHFTVLPGVPAEIVAGAQTLRPEDQQQLEAERTQLDRRIAKLEEQGALVWGGANFAAAKTRAAESIGARDGGSLALSEQRLSQASQLLDKVERNEVQHAAPPAKATPEAARPPGKRHAAETYETAAGEGFAALGAGRLAEARAAFERARALRPDGAEAADGLGRVNAASAQEAGGGTVESGAPAHAGKPATPGIAAGSDTATPTGGTPPATAGSASAGMEDTGPPRRGGAGAGAAGAGAVAAGAGAVAAGAGAAAASTGSGTAKLGSGRRHALDLEAQERWEDAVRAYEGLLRHDRSLAFAREGRDRAEARLQLNDALQAMLDRPDRIANSQQVREQARALLQEARTEPSGPVLSSQIERLGKLLPDSGKPVHIALLSDGETQVEIPSVGTFGSFSRRDIELRPGRYTIIGTRAGYRDVRRDIVVSPERENLTVNVSCSEPI